MAEQVNCSIMTHGDPAAAGQAGHAAPPRGRQTPVLTATQEPATSGGEDSGDNTTPTMSSKSGKMMSVKILMLDDSITVFQIQVREKIPPIAKFIQRIRIRNNEQYVSLECTGKQDIAIKAML